MGLFERKLKQLIKSISLSKFVNQDTIRTNSELLYSENNSDIFHSKGNLLSTLKQPSARKCLHIVDMPQFSEVRVC